MSWQLPSFSESTAGRLESVGLRRVLARLLAARGWDEPEAVARFLSPRLDHMHSPWSMKGMEAAVTRILAAVSAGESILIYGDYDVDGVTSVVVLRKALEMLGAAPQFHIPQRLAEGYGLHSAVVEQAAADGVRLILTVDNGIRAFEPVQRAAELGIDVIVTDHHLPEDGLPAACAILNPHQPDCPYPDKNLCGVGVVFKLVQALFEQKGRLQPGDWPNWMQAFLKLVAIGTIADAVPLLGENRVIARYGLAGLVRPVNPGLQALLQLALPGQTRVSADDIAFRIAPRLNAAGRMGGADRVIELFNAGAPEAGELARDLEMLNQARRETVERMLQEIDAGFAADPSLADSDVLVLDGDGWHRGVMGIVASRVLDRYAKPTLVIAREGEHAHGSGRAPEGVHLLELLETCPELFDRFGGHAQAVGFSLSTQRIAELRQRLNQSARLLPATATATPCADLEIRLGEIDLHLIDDLLRLEPCGQSNPTPVFLARGVTLAGAPRILKEKHLKLRLEQDGECFEALAWNVCGDTADNRRRGLPSPAAIAPGAALDVVFRIEYSEHPQYGNRIQLILSDYRMASGT